MAPNSFKTIEILATLFKACGTTRTEAAFAAFPAHLVPQSLTTAEQLAERAAMHQRDCRPATAPLLGYEITESGSERHKQFSVAFHFADGTAQVFAPHTN